MNACLSSDTIMGKYARACLSDSWDSFFSQNFPSNLIETLIGKNVANHLILEDLAQLHDCMTTPGSWHTVPG